MNAVKKLIDKGVRNKLSLLRSRGGKEGVYREFLDAIDFALVGGDINGDGSFRSHLW
ncbi:hypothetical protein F2Q69_00040225 [Brassica cretica]|uniref:Uncharacterized protein n=1 Tax=Brassica cretica TaxID=69181 RepID=A0A8S9NR99_BRACR|nr:hypothetical protein F2Q69_00040225 [Brassica cretica]